MPTQKEDMAMLAVLRTVGRWESFRGPTGVVCYLIPGSKGATYTVRPESCTCGADTHRRTSRAICKHRRALKAFENIAAAAERHRTMKEGNSDAPTARA